MARDFMIGILKHRECRVDGSRLPPASEAKGRKSIAPYRGTKGLRTGVLRKGN